MGFTPWIQRFLKSIHIIHYKLKNKAISTDAEKALIKCVELYQCLFNVDKNPPESEHRGTYISITKVIYDKPTGNIILNCEQLNVFFPKISNKTRILILATFIQHSFGNLSHINQGKEIKIKSIQLERKK